MGDKDKQNYFEEKEKKIDKPIVLMYHTEQFHLDMKKTSVDQEVDKAQAVVEGKDDDVDKGKDTVNDGKDVEGSVSRMMVVRPVDSVGGYPSSREI